MEGDRLRSVFKFEHHRPTDAYKAHLDLGRYSAGVRKLITYSSHGTIISGERTAAMMVIARWTRWNEDYYAEIRR